MRLMGFHFFLSLTLPILFCSGCQQDSTVSRPNIILIMSDDQGWGDTGYNGNILLQTPNLDKMAAGGIIFQRFYAAAPVCSPTRASWLTGRHPYRLGITHANTGHMAPEEITLAEVLKSKGYRTGHFGKWHLGTLTNDRIDANRGGRQPEHYAPPWEHGFDICFSTESKVPTWDPMITPGPEAMDIGKRVVADSFGTYFWNESGQVVLDNMDGDASRIVMDRVIPFIEQSGTSPFFAVIWFHAPHLPVLTGADYRQLYANQSEDIQHYYGTITALDVQIGRLLDHLEQNGQTDETMIFFSSDNGPEGKVRTARTQGSTGGLKGRKRSLYEGGIRVPGIWYWPGTIREPQQIDFPVVSSDLYPTILDLLDIPLPNQPQPLDGLSLKGLLDSRMTKRPTPIGFQSGKQLAWIGNRYKLYSRDGQEFELYDLKEDPAEIRNLSSTFSEQAVLMQKELAGWLGTFE